MSHWNIHIVGRLVRKELTGYLLDLRFVLAFGLCALLAVMSVYVGGTNYVRQLGEYSQTAESHRQTLESYKENRQLNYLRVVGERWSRRPETLSPIVYGLSGKLGQEVHIQFQKLPKFEASLLEEDPIYVVFGILDLAFVVKIALSLCVLLFTYDAICGEKEAGTLRLCASFPLARSTLAFAKLTGAIAGVLVPYLFAFLLAAAVLAAMPQIDMQRDDWLRMVALMGVFGLYLAVFAAFGLLVSSLTRRRMTAFLGLLGLWTVWVFVVPDLSVSIARFLRPTEGPVELLKRADAVLWENRGKRREEMGEYWRKLEIGDWDTLPDAQKEEIAAGEKRINDRWDEKLYPRMVRIRMAAQNQARRQMGLAMALSAVSPFGAATVASMDLARTGLIQKDWLEDAVGQHLTYMAQFIRKKELVPWPKRPELTDYTAFAYTRHDSLGDVLERNVGTIVNLVVLFFLGTAGAYVAILRYDVR